MTGMEMVAVALILWVLWKFVTAESTEDAVVAGPVSPATGCGGAVVIVLLGLAVGWVVLAAATLGFPCTDPQCTSWP